MSEFNITVEGGSAVRLLTAGKYCDRDIVVTAAGGGNATTEYERGYKTGCDDMVLKNVESYHNDSVTTLNNYAFYMCGKLRELQLPKLSAVSATMCYSCDMLTRIELPGLIGEIGTQAFRACSALEYVDLNAPTQIGTQAFYGCSALETFIIRRSDEICTLSNENSFTNTPIKKGTGFIYVPDNLVEQYKTATNWTTYADQFRAIEDYPDICGDV